jgi:serine/threonine protein kinase
MIAFACPGCGKSLKVEDEKAGKRGKCPSCGQRTLVPNATGEARPEPATAPYVPVGIANAKPGKPVARQEYAFLAPPQGPEELGRLGHYRVLKVLGSGGMGIVFEAEDTQLQRRVALKAMKPAVVNPENKERFLHEARATAALEHDHIVTIYQVGEDCGVPFLAMKLLQGQSLEERLKEEGGWLSVGEVLRIGREVAEGLAAAHAKGLIHRDIKPANIWLEQGSGRVRIVDFGLARAAETDLGLTQEGLVMGTPAYMAPEQADDKPLDHRCDLFGLGCVLYRMSTGQLPFKGKDAMSIMMALATKTPDEPRAIDPGVPPALSNLIMHLLAKDPDDRPASAKAVCDAVREIENGLSGASAAARMTKGPVAEGELKPLDDDDGDLKPLEDSEEIIFEADEAPEEAEEVEEIEAVEEAPEKGPRRRREQDGSGSRPRRRSHEQKEEEGSERTVIIIGVIAAGIIILLLAFLFLSRVFKSDTPGSGQRETPDVPSRAESHVARGLRGLARRSARGASSLALAGRGMESAVACCNRFKSWICPA